MSSLSVKKLLSYAINERRPDSSIILNPEHQLTSQLTAIRSSQIEPSSISVNNRLEPPSVFFSSQCEDVADKEPKKEFKNLTFENDLYEGCVLLNNLHGHGFFSSQKNGQKIFYDGLFYVNKLEGYGQIFYEDGAHFQGLFKQHKRYGPGVLTYPNGTQDVGFWNGFSLVRLAIGVETETVPRLVTTSIGKSKLLCYRYLVPLCNEDDDLAQNILKSIGANEEILKRSDEVLNLTIRNPNCSFFNKNFFDGHFFKSKDCTIKVAVEENDDSVSCEAEEDNVELFYRTRMLRTKIREMNETLEPFLIIKENLLERIFVCTKCCDVKDSDEITRVHEPSAAESHHTTPVSIHHSEEIIIDLASLKPDISLFDGSLQSFDVVPQPSDNGYSCKSPSETSTQKLVDFCICGEEEEIDDLQQLEDQLSNIMKRERFYRNIRDNLQNKLDDLLETEERKRENLEPKYKLVEVTELWAWNNAALMMDIQKHCFKHRHSEKMVNFSVPNLILGNRKEFEEVGEHEKLCIKFLLACSNGKTDFVSKCLRGNVNPNITDARGNSGVFFAVANSQIEVISILTNFGAKLDHINDEELTPLSLCILKYLSVKNKCDNWEKAFLPGTAVCKVPSLPKWYEVQSHLSMSSISSNKSESLVDRQSSHSDYFNSRIVQLFRRLSNMQQKTSSYVPNVLNATSYVFDLSYKNSDSNEKQADEQIRGHIQNELKEIHLTIMTLLDYGADPNLAIVPYPPLVLSVFTENPDMVLQILELHKDKNVLVTADNLSCLHIIASLKFCEYNIEICRLLALFKCNPNLKTLPTHWEDRKTYFTGNVPLDFYCEDVGKNALHLVCMRHDFDNDPHDYFGSMCKTLIKGGVDCRETYLGHTPLSLAVLIGNIRLVKYLIQLNAFDPYKNLDYGMGNVLTLFTLKRFESTLPIETCKAMLTALFEVNVNVLYRVGDAENAIDFAERGDVFLNLKSEERKVGKDKSKPASKPKKTDKHSQYGVLKEFLKGLGRDTIIRQFQMKVTEALYDFIEENVLEDYQIAVPMAEILTPRIAIANLEHLFHSEKNDAVRLNYDYVKKLLHFVDLHKKVVKSKKGALTATKGKKLKGSADTASPAEDTIDDLTSLANFKKSAVHLQRDAQFVCKPGLDDSTVYNVCFHCLKGNNKKLKMCPRCQMIQFCSEQCNKLNLKLKTQHTCNIVFYDMTDQQAQLISNGESLLDLAKAAKENCKMRLIKARESKLYQEELKLLEMWRADTYGTKFLKFKPLLAQAVKRRESQKFSLNVDGLIKLLEKNFNTNPADFDSYSIEAILFKLVNHQKLQDATTCTWDNFVQKFGSKLGSKAGSRMASRHGSVFSEFFVTELLKEDKPPCKCCVKKKPPNKRKESSCLPKKPSIPRNDGSKLLKVKYVTDTLQPHFVEQHGNVGNRETFSAAPAVKKKLKVIPSKYQKFIEIMGMYFPEVEVSNWLLPYACYSNGQLFYKFCDTDIFRESYSLS